MTELPATTRHEGGCHCGAARFAIELLDDEREVLDCNCTVCMKKGFLHFIVPERRFSLLRGADRLTTYTFGTHAAKHMFCATCGIHAYYRPRSHPDSWDVNVRCLDDVPLSRWCVRPFDGVKWEHAAQELAETVEHHKVLIDACRSMSQDAREALGWVCLDTKFERFAIAAICTAINRRAGKRIAHVEFTTSKQRSADGAKEARLDLVVLKDRIPSRAGRPLDAAGAQVVIRYESKAGQLFDFGSTTKSGEKYLGGELDRDMHGLKAGSGAGLFLISEIADPTRFLKPYAVTKKASIDDALAALTKRVTRGQLVAHEVIDCGVVDETEVKIHMCVFDPR